MTDVGPGSPARTVVGQLADPDRRRVLAAVELAEAGPFRRDLAGLVAATGLPDHRVTRALSRLVDSGLVVSGPDGFAVDAAVFTDAARTLLARPPSTEHDDQPAERRGVLAAFVRDGRITALPTARAKRLVLLDWLAQRFAPGQRYREREVNAILAEHHDDVATWRRYLVDEEFLGRTADGSYWRTGGSFDTAPSEV